VNNNTQIINVTLLKYSLYSRNFNKYKVLEKFP